MWKITPSDRTVWTIGRVFVDAPRARDQWLVDYVLDDTDRLVAVCRSRPSRGHVAPLSRVVGEAFTAPLGTDAPSRRPVRLEFLDMHVHKDLLELKLPIEVAFSRRRKRTLEAIVTRLIDGYIEPDDQWHWLQRGVPASLVDRLFDLCYGLTSSYGWYVLSGRELVTVHFTRRRQTLWLRLVARRRLDNHLQIGLHVATHPGTVDSWRRGELGPDTIVVAAVDQDDLPVTAWEECCRMGRLGAIACPAITVGLKRRMPSPTEMVVAAEALESMAALFEEHITREHLELRRLPSGEEIRIEVGPEELTMFTKNDGGLEPPLRREKRDRFELAPS